MGTVVERKTRFVVLCRMDGCTSQSALEGFSRQMKVLPVFLRESLSCDCGSEMACHQALAKRLQLDSRFCDSRAPWQCGSNENTSGLLRQFLPKGMNLSDVSQSQLNDIHGSSMDGQGKRGAGERLTKRWLKKWPLFHNVSHLIPEATWLVRL